MPDIASKMMPDFIIAITLPKIIQNDALHGMGPSIHYITSKDVYAHLNLHSMLHTQGASEAH